MPKWLLPTLSEVLARRITRADHVVPQVGQTTVMENSQRRVISRMARSRVKAEREWCGAIASLETLLVQAIDTQKQESPVNGLVLTGPVPILSHPSVISHFQAGIFTADSFHALALMPFQLPPATHTTSTEPTPNHTLELPLLPADPLATEQFCLVFTGSFSLVMVLGEDSTGTPAFQFSFDPDEIEQAWASLRSRVLLASPHQINYLDTLVKQFAPSTPDYRTVMEFSRQLLKHLPEEVIEKGEEVEKRRVDVANSQSPISYPHSKDVELLQAFTHEIRTPLTTIRTLTQLLLKRRDLAPDIARRLEIIDRECTEQINRMELIFRAVELATSEMNQASVHLTTMSLNQLLEQSIPRWQKQALRRNVTLEVVLPQKLPAVVSNPAMLDQVLTGLMENFTRSLPGGGHIQVEVTPTGDQLKLQFQSQPNCDETGMAKVADSGCKSIGQLLMFQPETGSLSLNLNVTKNLFQIMGGKLIVRQRPQQGEVLTIFLPLEVGSTKVVSY